MSLVTYKLSTGTYKLNNESNFHR